MTKTLLTTGDIAEQSGISRDRICYITRGFEPDLIAGKRKLFGPRKAAKIIEEATNPNPRATTKPRRRTPRIQGAEEAVVDFAPLEHELEAAKARRTEAQAAVDGAKARGDDEKIVSAALAELIEAKRAALRAYLTLAESAALNCGATGEETFRAARRIRKRHNLMT